MAGDIRKYRLYALECVAKARAADTPQEKAAFLNLSARWSELAAAAEVEQSLLAQDDDEPLASSAARRTCLH
jgi:hypothetical protein